MKIGLGHLLVFCFLSSGLFAQLTEKYKYNQSLTYQEAIAAFEELDKEYGEIKLIETNYKTDVGRNLHVVIFNNDKKFDPSEVDRSEKVVFFINNAIHPGESCGVDATVKLFERLGRFHKLYENVVVVAIPVYNIGGMLNRSPYNRSGQPGPTECGFRGNYQNLDLNRDFIKMDALNTAGFVQLFQSWKPNLFMDTHTTNGSDHQYTVTLITSQEDKMNPELAGYVFGKMEPLIFRKMEERNKEIIPYVYSVNKTPEKGIKDFMETPRYSSGYANLFNCISFISEAHKYKNFTQRVEHTYSLLDYMCEFASRSNTDLIEVKRRADEFSRNQNSFALNWKLDTSKSKKLEFKGFEIESVKSEVTGLSRVNYNHEKKKTYSIDYYRNYVVTDSVIAPKAYIIPQCYTTLIENMKLNNVVLNQIDRDTILEGEMYRIEELNTSSKAYEKHFYHKKVGVSKKMETVKFYKGDYLVMTNQANKRFIVETLEPHSVDSYFRWNFFDNVLQQKEWFSDFAFDPIAKDLLLDNDNLNQEFKKKRQSDSTFANDHFTQLYWVFKRSSYYEETHNRYPVMRYAQ